MCSSDLEDAYQIVQSNAGRSWEEKKDFRDLIRADKKTGEYFSASEFDELFDYGYYTRYVDETFARLGLTKPAKKKKQNAATDRHRRKTAARVGRVRKDLT